MAKRLHYRVIEGEFDAEAVYRQLFYRQGASFWLGSARLDAGYSRFSFLGSTGCGGGRLLRYRLGQGVEICDGVQSRVVTQDIFGFLEQALAGDPVIDSTELPFDFAGGFVGYFGYELMALMAGVVGKLARHPDACWIEADSFLAIDQLEQRSYLVCIDADPLAATAWLDEMAERLRSVTPITDTAKPVALVTDQQMEPYLEQPRAAYLQAIEDSLACIVDGDSYEVCLTNRLRLPTPASIGSDPLRAYTVLRQTNPAPYACFLVLPEVAVLCSSPERFLKLDRAGVQEARSIKGTLPHLADPEQDRQQAERLAIEEHFFSENLMIVDLMRNDLARVCRPGSIAVPQLMLVESYTTVHQLLSVIQRQCTAGVVDCVRACFPPGSMTGAPKKRTLQIIDQLESSARGIYSGGIGYLSRNGCLDLNVVIRTIVLDREQIEIGVGVPSLIFLTRPWNTRKCYRRCARHSACYARLSKCSS